MSQAHILPRRHIPAYRKAAYSVAVTCMVFAVVEVACRLLFSQSNGRWAYHSQLVESVGFPQLNGILEPDLELFWRLKRDLASVRIVGRIGDSDTLEFRVSTDERGYRRMPKVQQAADTVLCLGDSCTFGFGVNDGQTFASLLQARIADTQCVNTGVPGYSSYQGQRMLKRCMATLASDIVVISFLFNDSSSWDERSDMEHAALSGRFAARVIRLSRFVGLVAQTAEKIARPRQRQRRPRLSNDEYAEQLQQIVNDCQRVGSRPVLLVWPLREQMATGLLSDKQEVMRNLAAERDIPLVDAVPVFRQRGGTDLFLDVVHATPTGHQLIAELLEPVLREQLASGASNE